MTNLTHVLDALLAAHVGQGKGLIMGDWETTEGECPLNILGRLVAPLITCDERRNIGARYLAEKLEGFCEDSDGRQWVDVPARRRWLEGVIIGWDASAEQSREQISYGLANERLEGAMVGETLARKYHWSVEYKGGRWHAADPSTELLYGNTLHPSLKLSEQEVWEKYARKVSRWSQGMLRAEREGLYFDSDSVCSGRAVRNSRFDITLLGGAK